MAQIDLAEVERVRQATELFGTLAKRTEGMEDVQAAVMVSGAVGAWLFLWTQDMTEDDRDVFSRAFLASLIGSMQQVREQTLSEQ